MKPLPTMLLQIVSLTALHDRAANATVKTVAFSLAAALVLQSAPVSAQTPPAPVVDRSTGVTKPSAPAVPAATAAPATPAANAAAPQPTAPAIRFVTIGDKPAVMYDAPSNRANKQFIILRNTPMEVLVKLDRWLKLRDADGSTNGWVENEFVGQRRQVMVNVASADVRAAAAESAAKVFDAQRGVLLEVTGAANDGWMAVKHRDGQAGFVRLAHVFGN